DVQAVEADPVVLRPAVVVLPQPLAEPRHLLVGPHPGRPALEHAQRLPGGGSRVGPALDVAVEAVTVGPVALDGDKGEAPVADQPLAQGGPPLVELAGAV